MSVSAFALVGREFCPECRGIGSQAFLLFLRTDDRAWKPQ
jgi:hypothetical protein